MIVLLPKKLEEKIKKESKRLDIPEEELISKVLSEFFKEPLDPESRVELHLKLCEKYLKEADELLSKGDYVQASKKAWSAASQIAKALAAKEGRELRSHAELHKFVSELRNKMNDPEISTLWLSANSLHQNFYENWLPEETVRDGVENVKKFVEKLRRLL